MSCLRELVHQDSIQLLCHTGCAMCEVTSVGDHLIMINHRAILPKYVTFPFFFFAKRNVQSGIRMTQFRTTCIKIVVSHLWELMMNGLHLSRECLR